jgi:DNA-binding CsgD family transcriptional regulator
MLQQRDAELLFDLVGELGELAQDAAVWQAHLLERLNGHLGGRIGLSNTVLHPQGDIPDALGAQLSGGRRQMISRGLPSSLHDTVVGAMTNMEASGDPTAPFIRRCGDTSFTALRQQMVESRAWYASKHVQELRRSVGVDSFIVSSCVVPGYGAHVFGIHRAWGDKPFRERDRVVVQLLHRELARLWSRSGVFGWPSTPVRLPLRLRQVLGHLCSGMTEKEIAAAMDLSQHTVHEYIKELYRRIGVRGRSELTAWLVRQIRSRPAPVW